MRLTALFALVVCSLVPGSATGSSGAAHSVSTVKVCGHPIVLRIWKPMGSANSSVDAWVNGHRLLGYISEGDGYLFGRSTLVQWPVNEGRHGTFRAVRTVNRCASLRVVVSR